MTTQDMTAIVTGAASGIGRAVARRLRDSGHRVAACDISPTVTDMPDGFQLDVTDPTAVEELVAHVAEHLPPITALVNTAGILRGGELTDCRDEDWQAMLAVNTTGVLNVTRAVARRMIPRRRGAVVTVSSNAAGVPRQGIGGYAATKAAATHLTRCFGLELASHGIRCNMVAPGSTDTPMLRSMWGVDHIDPAAVAAGDPGRFRLGIPLGTVASVDDVAAAVAFLISDDAAQLTMQELYVDGGAALR